MEQNNREPVPRRQAILAWLRIHKRSTTVTLVVLLLLAIASLLSFCGPEWQRQIAVQRATYFEKGQVLVAGMDQDIAQVIDDARQRLAPVGATLTLSTTVQLTFFEQLDPECPVRSRLAEGKGTYVIDQYLFTGKVTEQTVIETIQQSAQSLGVSVSPELNYRIGRPPVTTGTPWSVGGGPWSVGGGPWSVGGGAMGWELVELANKAFEEQWAFTKDGINLEQAVEEDLPTGQGVRVGVFDTLPLPVNVSSIVVDMDPPLNLTLVHHMPGGRLDPKSRAPDIDDHGLFVAGLVHGVAPGSEIQLIRVLDDTALGNVQTLNAALNNFINQVIEDRRELKGAVINLSLTAEPKPGADPNDPPHKVDTLQSILDGAQCLPIVVVAAAGNGSADSDTGLPAERPGAWESVISVAASNQGQQRACFSNCGQVAAPGGEGKPKCLKKCVPALDECIKAERDPDRAPEGCPYAVMSLALSSQSGYAYWAGTSFAAPQISGLAARIIDADGGWKSREYVLEKLRYAAIRDACIETGIPDVAASLQSPPP